MAWQSEFKATNDRDQAEIVKYLSDIKNTQSIIAMTQNQHSADIKAIMALMQQVREWRVDLQCRPHLLIYSQNLSITPSYDTQGLGSNLYRVQKSTGKLLANMHLQRGEVRRLGQYPVSGTGSMDIWEGLYLNEEKVAIKILRAVHSNPKSLEVYYQTNCCSMHSPSILQRFRREVNIWNKVWENDQGRRILPLYGFCQDDGPFPCVRLVGVQLSPNHLHSYVVSPWHPNGTADKYVARFPAIDHLALVSLADQIDIYPIHSNSQIRGISTGVHVLHTMVPPIVHGDLKGVHINTLTCFHT